MIGFIEFLQERGWIKEQGEELRIQGTLKGDW